MLAKSRAAASSLAHVASSAAAVSLVRFPTPDGNAMHAGAAADGLCGSFAGDCRFESGSAAQAWLRLAKLPHCCRTTRQTTPERTQAATACHCPARRTWASSGGSGQRRQRPGAAAAQERRQQPPQRQRPACLATAWSSISSCACPARRWLHSCAAGCAMPSSLRPH